MLRLSETCCVMLEMKAGPLSDCRVQGSPNLGMMCSMRIVVTTSAVSLEVGNALIQPVKVSMRVSRYLKVLCRGM